MSLPTTNRRWIAAICVFALLAIAGVHAGLPWLHYVFKPLTTLAVAAMVVATSRAEPAYRRAVIAGLVLSTAGDVFLMLPGDRFVYGLAAFLAAHVAYLVAFTRRAPLLASVRPFALYAASAAAGLGVLWPNLPDGLHVPVVAYVVVLAAMAAQAAAVWRRRPVATTAHAAFGGAFFVASDATLAIDRFVAPLAAASFVVLATYWIAQTLIALSATDRAE